MGSDHNAIQTSQTQNWGGQQADRSTGFDQIKTSVSSRLNEFAETLQSKAQNALGNNRELANYSSQAADWVKRSAQYVDDFDPQQVKKDISEQVRRNPGKTLLIATAAGLLLGSLFRRR
jgi:ElaB/YqjD/DUF883 family membrane-anchored ribosome-binding protein